MDRGKGKSRCALLELKEREAINESKQDNLSPSQKKLNAKKNGCC